jgi:hypothetical protein
MGQSTETRQPMKLDSKKSLQLVVMWMLPHDEGSYVGRPLKANGCLEGKFRISTFRVE